MEIRGAGMKAEEFLSPFSSFKPEPPAPNIPQKRGISAPARLFTPLCKVQLLRIRLRCRIRLVISGPPVSDPVEVGYLPQLLEEGTSNTVLPSFLQSLFDGEHLSVVCPHETIHLEEGGVDFRYPSKFHAPDHMLSLKGYIENRRPHPQHTRGPFSLTSRTWPTCPGRPQRLRSYPLTFAAGLGLLPLRGRLRL
ncbi:hypothetical protein Dgeo_2295 [Deinococcus geothermalis DSM 11300]|uniref:Uncharacterized protein n=1 Tax=Deinococcus geothermalis (strain DSM 11300 / CIP 105573 / AG-3a) TaxID=319795 RepID=Q1IVZ5_DEIGD|nr:hypothetical protein Dgeo_2295 [Deinococcus geothermalis DSM 11300]